MASAVQTAQIVNRIGVQPGIVGGYQSVDAYIGGIGGAVEAEFALSKAFSISADAGGGYNAMSGPIAEAGLDLKYQIAKLKLLDLSLIGYGRGYYLFAADEDASYLYGGGALALATLELGYLSFSAGGGASYDIFTGPDGDSAGTLGPVAIANIKFPIAKSAELGLAFEYGGDRFFLGAFLDFAIGQPAGKKAEPAVKKVEQKPAAKTTTPAKAAPKTPAPTKKTTDGKK